MCPYTGQWVTFWSQLLPGTVVNGEMTDCQPNPVTHHGLQNELAELRQASSNKRANTLGSLSSKVAPQNEGSEVVGGQHGMYWR